MLISENDWHKLILCRSTSVEVASVGLFLTLLTSFRSTRHNFHVTSHFSLIFQAFMERNVR